MARFDGKKVIICQVSDGISKADELIERACAGDASVYCADTKDTMTAAGKSTKTGEKSGGVAHQIYTQLMNGVSHMLPFVVGGGILIAIAFLIDGMNVNIEALPADQRADFWYNHCGCGVLQGYWWDSVRIHASCARRLYCYGHR